MRIFFALDSRAQCVQEDHNGQWVIRGLAGPSDPKITPQKEDIFFFCTQIPIPELSAQDQDGPRELHAVARSLQPFCP